MRYAEKMDRPLSDDDRLWLRENNFGDVADRFDVEDGVGSAAPDESEDAEEVSPRNYSGMTVPELKAEITRRNTEILAEDPEAKPIPLDGLKADLIAQLERDDELVSTDGDEGDDE